MADIHELGNIITTFPSATIGSSTYPVKINTNPNGQVIVTSGQTTLDKALAAVLTGLALIKGSPYIPTTQQPQPQADYSQNYAALMAQQQYLAQQQNSSAGANLGGSIQDFITNNTGLLLAGGLALVLFKSGRK